MDRSRIYTDLDAKAILESLEKNENVSTNELWRMIERKTGGIGKSTFYKKIHLLINKGLIHRFERRNRVLYGLGEQILVDIELHPYLYTMQAVV